MAENEAKGQDEQKLTPKDWQKLLKCEDFLRLLDKISKDPDYEEAISNCRKKLIEMEKNSGDSPPNLDILEKGKNYFFVLNRRPDNLTEHGHRWELDTQKMNKNKGEVAAIDSILSEFKNRVEAYDVIPQESREYDFETLNKDKLNIKFMKNSDSQVVGFVKILPSGKESSNKWFSINKSQMYRVNERKYQEITDIMREIRNAHPDVLERIYYYVLTVRQLKPGNS